MTTDPFKRAGRNVLFSPVPFSRFVVSMKSLKKKQKKNTIRDIKQRFRKWLFSAGYVAPQYMNVIPAMRPLFFISGCGGRGGNG